MRRNTNIGLSIVIRSINELTQESLGRLFEPPVTQPTVARWEKGEQMPDQIHFPKIAYFLDSTQEQLRQLIENSFINVDSLHIEKKIFAPNKKHLNILKRGVISWNKWREKNPDIIPVLAGIELNHFDLDRINLDRADLRGIKLSRVDSRFSSYRMANMRYAHLNQVIFLNSDFSQANIAHSKLRYSNFRNTNLFNSNLYNSKLTKIDLNSANLNKANLNKANIIISDLSGANCIGASFENSGIYESNVFGASFIEAKVNGVKLEDVYLSPSKSNNNSLPINDLLSAKTIYIQRYNRAKFESIQREFKMEEENINLANVLAKKYGNYYYPEDLNTFNNDQDNNQVHFVEIQIGKEKFRVRFRLNYNNTKLILPETNLDAPLKIDRSRIILDINNNIIESNTSLKK